MASARFTLSPDHLSRYKEFLSSPEYATGASGDKSPYWQEMANAIDIQIVGTSIRTEGKAGHHIPRQLEHTLPSRRLIREKLAHLVRNPSLVFRSRLNTYRSRFTTPRLLTYYEAFDAVMSGRESFPGDYSPYRMDFSSLGQLPGSVGSMTEMRERYFGKAKYEIGFKTVMSYHHRNIIGAHVDLSRVTTVVEVGAGNGNLMTLLASTIDNSTIIDIDLPETISHSVLFVLSIFPDAKVLLPNEVDNSGIDFRNYDFVFLTPQQTNLLDDDIADLVISTNAFQEMTTSQIHHYFDLTQRLARNNAYFYCFERVDKIPSSSGSSDLSTEPNRFSEYPWKSCNSTLAYEICPVVRLTQYDNCYFRLEKIQKL